MRQQYLEAADFSSEKAAPAPVEPAVQQRGQKLGVLVVDDDHLIRFMLQRSLEQDGFDIWLAANGREAIDLYRQHSDHIDVVLLDICLPGLDGPQTLAALRELNPEVTACFMGGYAGDQLSRELLQRGAAYMIAKPFHLNQLAHILRLAANGVHSELISAGAVCQG